jgi:hypothetical protein
MSKRIFTVALLALSLASAGNLSAQDNRNSNTKQPTVEDRRSDTGWVWIPGSRWAPAWVSWRESSDHVGWAPLPPEVADDSQTRVGGWVDNYYDIGPAAYLFVKIGDLSRPTYRDVILRPANNVETHACDGSISFKGAAEHPESIPGRAYQRTIE